MKATQLDRALMEDSLLKALKFYQKGILSIDAEKRRADYRPEQSLLDWSRFSWAVLSDLKVLLQRLIEAQSTGKAVILDHFLLEGALFDWKGLWAEPLSRSSTQTLLTLEEGQVRWNVSLFYEAFIRHFEPSPFELVNGRLRPKAGLRYRLAGGWHRFFVLEPLSVQAPQKAARTKQKPCGTGL